MQSIPMGAATAALFCVLTAGVADAHVSISSGPAAANKSQKITFTIGHGCENADTVAVRVEIPAAVSSVRALRSDFGKPSIERGAGNAISAVVWRKPDADVQDEDIGYYDLTIRARVGNVPFTQIYFKIHQTCRTATGVETTVSWAALPGEAGEPAPAVAVVPTRQAGWNKYVVGANVSIAAADLPTYFGDALIVWRGSAAYSANPITTALIASTAGVASLTDLAPNDEIWVKY